MRSCGGGGSEPPRDLSATTASASVANPRSTLAAAATFLRWRLRMWSRCSTLPHATSTSRELKSECAAPLTVLSRCTRAMDL